MPTRPEIPYNNLPGVGMGTSASLSTPSSPPPPPWSQAMDPLPSFLGLRSLNWELRGICSRKGHVWTAFGSTSKLPQCKPPEAFAIGIGTTANLCQSAWRSELATHAIRGSKVNYSQILRPHVLFALTHHCLTFHCTQFSVVDRFLGGRGAIF